MKGFSLKNPVLKEIKLYPGTYIILPRSTGCILARPEEATI